MFRIEKESFTYGDKEVTLETGEFARQAPLQSWRVWEIQLSVHSRSC